MQHIGFLVAPNTRHKDFRYVLMRSASNTRCAVKTPGGDTVPVLLTMAKKQGAKLLLNPILDAETKAAVQKIWGK